MINSSLNRLTVQHDPLAIFIMADGKDKKRRQTEENGKNQKQDTVRGLAGFVQFVMGDIPDDGERQASQ
jgi:hypothetical protein